MTLMMKTLTKKYRIRYYNKTWMRYQKKIMKNKWKIK